jgi:hypothetical protein
VAHLLEGSVQRAANKIRVNAQLIDARTDAHLPVGKDSPAGSQMLVYFAIIAAWVGENDLALQYLATNGQSQGGVQVATFGVLKLHPLWDPLRGDPRFEKIVTSLAPKEP